MKLSTKLFTGFAFVALLFLVVTFINYDLSQDVLASSSWVSQSQIITRNSASLQRNMIDMETGLRGYLLTGQEEYLDPYVQAKDQIPSLIRDMEKMVAGVPEQLSYIDRIQQMHNRWQNDFAEVLIAEKREQMRENPEANLTALKSAGLLRSKFGKRITDSTRVLFRNFNGLEYRVRDNRYKRLSNTINYTRKVSSGLTLISLVLGFGWTIYISRLISGRIMTMVNLADRIAKGEYKTKISDTGHDELSRLSSSLDKMAGTIDHNITELERKNRELDQFAYVVSHDLKAPLRGIENASRWIEEDMPGDLPQKIQEYLLMMRVRINRMENLINGILELARIGRTKKMEELVDVRLLLTEILDNISVPTGFRTEIPEFMPKLYTVRIYLEQVFSNLITNAIKYNSKPDGLVRISWSESSHFFSFSVTDNGPGIDPEYHDKIFVIFQTLQERDAVESTGVGLAIVRKIVERQGGVIRLDSHPGEGSTFTFTWPKVRPPET